MLLKLNLTNINFTSTIRCVVHMVSRHKCSYLLSIVGIKLQVFPTLTSLIYGVSNDIFYIVLDKVFKDLSKLLIYRVHLFNKRTVFITLCFLIPCLDCMCKSDMLNTILTALTLYSYYIEFIKFSKCEALYLWHLTYKA